MTDAVERAAALREYAEQTAGCTKCALAAGRTQVVFGSGNPDADLMFVGEAPGFHEDQQGVPFVGQAGKLLDRLLEGIGLTRADVFVANVLKCRPPGNRDPLPGGDRGVRAAPLPPDRADRARARRDARQLRDEAPLGPAGRHHACPRSRAGGHARRTPRLAVSHLPPGGGALHALDAQGARGGLRPYPGAPRTLSRHCGDSSRRLPPSSSQSPIRFSSGLF